MAQPPRPAGRIASSSAPTGAASLPPTLVEEVELRLPPRLSSAGVPALVTINKGQPLSLHEVRRTLQLLYSTGRFSDVVIRSEPMGAGLKVIVEVSAKQLISSVAVQGNRALTVQEIREAARLPENGEYYPERLRTAVEAVASAYRQRGYYGAQISIELTELPSGLEVLFRVEEGDATRAQEVTIAGSPGLPLRVLLPTIGISVGDILDRKQLNKGLEKLKALYRAERFFRARIGEPEITLRSTGARIELPISAGPQYTFHFHHNRSFPDSVLKEVMHYDGGEVLDRVVIGRLARRLEAFYRYHGFHDVRIRPEDTRSPDQSRAILGFNVEEGPLIRVSAIEFSGNQQISTAELRQVVVNYVLQRQPAEEGLARATDDPLDLEGRSHNADQVEVPDADPATVLLEDAYRDAALGLTQLYKERGFSRAEVTFVSADLEAQGNAVAKFEVVEGPLAIIRDVRFSHAPPGFNGRTVLSLSAGSRYSHAAVEQSAAALTQALQRAGYVFAQIEVTSRVSVDGRDAEVEFTAKPGERVRVGQVIIQGLSRTAEALVRANLKVRTGQILDPDKLYETQRDLLRLGIFKQVAVQLISPDAESAVKDVLVDVKEEPRASGSWEPGYFLVDGPRLGADFVYPNLGGQGINLTGRAKINYVGASLEAIQNQAGFQQNVTGLNGVGGRINIGLQQPRIYQFLPAEIGARLDLIGERVFRPSYRFFRVAVIPGLEWLPFKWLDITLQYELEYDSIDTSKSIETLRAQTTNPTDLERLRYPSGQFPLQTLRSTVSADFRDNPANPQRGVLLSATAEVTHDLGALQFVNGSALPDPIFTLKVFGTASVYVPVLNSAGPGHPALVLALSARAGRFFFPDPHDTNTIGPKRFFLGGATTLRGFNEDGVVGEDRRAQIHDELSACRALANPAGCSANALALLSGQVIPSEGGELFTLGKAELRYGPLGGGFELALFGEAGDLWFDPKLFQLVRLRYNVGIGLRYETPVGPAAFDVGFNLSPDLLLNDPIYHLNFSIGVF